MRELLKPYCGKKILIFTEVSGKKKNCRKLCLNPMLVPSLEVLTDHVWMSVAYNSTLYSCHGKHYILAEVEVYEYQKDISVDYAIILDRVISEWVGVDYQNMETYVNFIRGRSVLGYWGNFHYPQNLSSDYNITENVNNICLKLEVDYKNEHICNHIFRDIDAVALEAMKLLYGAGKDWSAPRSLRYA